LEEGIKLKGAPARIYCSRLELPRLLKNTGRLVGVEVGVYKAEFTEYFCREGLKIYGVDPWSDYPLEKRQERQDFLYEHAKRVVKDYPNCTFIRKTSIEAAKDFEDESLDFVYIDGNHCFMSIAEDLYTWTPKIKKGGIISGHDYAHTPNPRIDKSCLHVKFVVDAWIKCFDINNWYVIGGMRGGDYPDIPYARDVWKSFLWIKQ